MVALFGEAGEGLVEFFCRLRPPGLASQRGGCSEQVVVTAVGLIAGRGDAAQGGSYDVGEGFGSLPNVSSLEAVSGCFEV